MIRPIGFLSAAIVLAACTALPTPDVARLSEPGLTQTTALGPPNARSDACYGREITPAVTREVSDMVLVQPAQLRQDGTVLDPPIYRDEIRVEILRERKELWFEIPCDFETDAPFVANLQRALTARKLYSGPINGLYDARTRRAVRRFQQPEGLDSAILSLAAARKLGLVKIPRPQNNG